jgi:hypothetical protein
MLKVPLQQALPLGNGILDVVVHSKRSPTDTQPGQQAIKFICDV